MWKKDRGASLKIFSRQIISMGYTAWIKQKPVSLYNTNAWTLGKAIYHGCWKSLRILAQLTRSLPLSVCRPFLRTVWPPKHLWGCSNISPALTKSRAAIRCESLYPVLSLSLCTTHCICRTPTNPTCVLLWDLGDVGNRCKRMKFMQFAKPWADQEPEGFCQHLRNRNRVT